MQDHEIRLGIDGPALPRHLQARNDDILVRQFEAQAFQQFGLGLIELDGMKSVGNASGHRLVLPYNKTPASLLPSFAEVLV
jgi:hypothetical protein